MKDTVVKCSCSYVNALDTTNVTTVTFVVSFCVYVMSKEFLQNRIFWRVDCIKLAPILKIGAR